METGLSRPLNPRTSLARAPEALGRKSESRQFAPSASSRGWCRGAGGLPVAGEPVTSARPSCVSQEEATGLAVGHSTSMSTAPLGPGQSPSYGAISPPLLK